MTLTLYLVASPALGQRDLRRAKQPGEACTEDYAGRPGPPEV